MTLKAIRDMLRTFQEFWNKDVSEQAVMLWDTALSHIPDDAAPALIATVLRTSKFWPVPAVVCEAYADLAVGDDGAEEAWRLVVDYASGPDDLRADDLGMTDRHKAALTGALSLPHWSDVKYFWLHATVITIAGWRKAFMECWRKTAVQERRSAQVGYQPIPRERIEAPRPDLAPRTANPGGGMARIGALIEKRGKCTTPEEGIDEGDEIVLNAAMPWPRRGEQ